MFVQDLQVAITWKDILFLWANLSRMCQHMALGEDYFVFSHNNSMANYKYMYTVYDIVVLFSRVYFGYLDHVNY